MPACAGTSTSTSAGTSGGISSEQFVSQLTDAFCDNIASCCRAAAIAFELATCKVNAGAFFQGSLEQVLSLKVSYVADAAAQCVAAYASVAKSCASWDNSLLITAACRQVFVGTLPVGAPCTDSDECARVAGSSVGCSGSPSATCVATAKLTLGASCTDTCGADTDCANSGTSARGGTSTPGFCYADDGLYCDSTNTCQPLLAVDQACDAFGGCTSGAFCAGGVCTTLESCVDGSDCAGGFCQPGPDGTQMCTANGIASAINCAGTLGAGAD
ncbi:MAG TPA: hypothetical protein VGF76_23290 [Polyangiaceae bacterium]